MGGGGWQCTTGEDGFVFNFSLFISIEMDNGLGEKSKNFSQGVY